MTITTCPIPVLSPAEYDRGGLLARLRADGVLVLRNASAGLADFLDLSERLGGRFLRHGLGPGEYRMVGAAWSRHLVGGRDSLFTASPPALSQALDLHGELYFHMLSPPHLLWFYCRHAGDAAAATLICDGRALYEALSPADQAVFRGRSLVYERVQTRARWQEQYQAGSVAELTRYLSEQHHRFELLPDGTLITRFERPALCCPGGRLAFVNNFIPFALSQLEATAPSRSRIAFADGHPIDVGLVGRVTALARELTRPLRWQRGDICLIDNTRMLHGRGPLDPDTGRELYIRMSWSDEMDQDQKPGPSLCW